MQNAGTWNSDVALFYLIVFTFPLWLSLLCGAFGAMININHFEFGDVYIIKDKKKKKKKKHPKEITFEGYKESKTKNSHKIIREDVLSALKNMGFKNKESKEMISQALLKYPYGNFDTLLNECIRKK